MKGKFSILERLTICGVLPNEGNLVTLRAVRQAQEMFALEPGLDKKTNMRAGAAPGTVVWDADKDPQKQIDIPPAIFALIMESFQKLDEQKKLNLEQAAVYDRLLPVWEKK